MITFDHCSINGYDAYSKMFVGYQVSGATKQERVRGCRCKLNEHELTYNCCPHCGKKVYKMEEVNLRNILEEADDFHFNIGVRTYECDEFYVGKSLDYISLQDLETKNFREMAEELAAALKQYGIEVDIDSFGIYNFLYESY